MSWQDELTNIQFEIVTGDGKKWRPSLIVNYIKNIEFNGTQYDFINRAGSLFARRLPRGRSFPLEFAFTGKDNVATSMDFEHSTRDIKPWSITHPFYGNFKAQPMSIELNNSGLDSSIIRCVVIETIISIAPSQKTDTVDLLNIKLVKVAQVSTTTLANSKYLTNLSAKENELIAKNVNKIAKITSKVLKTQKEYKAWRSSFDKVLNQINNVAGFTTECLTYINAMITLPAILAADIGSRWNTLESILSTLELNIVGMTKLSYFDKLFYNLIGGICITSMSKSLTVRNKGDFETRSEALFYVTRFQKAYDSYLKNMSLIEDEAFVSDHDFMFSLHQLVCDTSFYLYQLLFELKQERIIYTKTDTNLIVITHQVYGSASDENIEYLKSTNKIGLSEIINIKQGREIKYYL